MFYLTINSTHFNNRHKALDIKMVKDLRDNGRKNKTMVLLHGHRFPLTSPQTGQYIPQPLSYQSRSTGGKQK